MKAAKTVILTLSALLVFTGLLSACHTIKGIGQDVQAGGHAISKAAD